MIKTKSIILPKEDSDGLRISVMSRHTLNDGVTPDLRSYDLWMPIFAPTPKLIGDYYKRNLTFEKFEQRYLEQIRKPEIQNQIRNLIELGTYSTITLLCIEDSPENCHRRLLAEECKNWRRSLELYIR